MPDESNLFWYETQREMKPGNAISLRYVLTGRYPNRITIHSSLDGLAEYLSSRGPLELYRYRVVGAINFRNTDRFKEKFEGAPVLYFQQDGNVLVRGASGDGDELYTLQNLIIQKLVEKAQEENLKELGIRIGSFRK